MADYIKVYVDVKPEEFEKFDKALNIIESSLKSAGYNIKIYWGSDSLEFEDVVAYTR